MKILIMGHSGSGKTTIAEKLSKIYNIPWINADVVRHQYNDWDFSYDGRIRQVSRLSSIAKNFDNCIVDFIAPLEDQRNIFKADFVIWMDTIKKGKYKDTSGDFVPPESCDIRVTTFDFNYWIKFITKDLTSLFS